MQLLQFCDLHAVLGIDTSAGDDLVAKAARQHMFQHHPDRTKSSDAAEKQRRTERFVLVNTASSTLGDRSQRDSYVSVLAEHVGVLRKHLSSETTNSLLALRTKGHDEYVAFRERVVGARLRDYDAEEQKAKAMIAAYSQPAPGEKPVVAAMPDSSDAPVRAATKHPFFVSTARVDAAKRPRADEHADMTCTLATGIFMPRVSLYTKSMCKIGSVYAAKGVCGTTDARETKDACEIKDVCERLVEAGVAYARVDNSSITGETTRCVVGRGNAVALSRSIIIGSGNTVTGSFNYVKGTNCTVSGMFNIVDGSADYTRLRYSIIVSKGFNHTDLNYQLVHGTGNVLFLSLEDARSTKITYASPRSKYVLWPSISGIMTHKIQGYDSLMERLNKVGLTLSAVDYTNSNAGADKKTVLDVVSMIKQHASDAAKNPRNQVVFGMSVNKMVAAEMDRVVAGYNMRVFT